MLERSVIAQHCNFHIKGNCNGAENSSAVKWLQKLGNEAAEFAAVCIVGVAGL